MEQNDNIHNREGKLFKTVTFDHEDVDEEESNSYQMTEKEKEQVFLIYLNNNRFM
jgi:hypothetical protein